MKSSYFLGILILISIYWMGILYKPFLFNIIIAILFVLATTHIYFFALSYLRRPLFASLAATIIMGTLFLSPIIYFITTIAIQLTQIDLVNLINNMLINFKFWVNHDLPQSLSSIKPYLLEFAESEEIKKFATSGLNIIAKIGGKSASFLSDIFFIVVFYFFTLLYGKQIGNFFKDIIPLKSNYTYSLYNEAVGVMSVVFYSILVTAIFEGFLFAIIAYIFNYDALFFGILYGFASLIPIVGGALMWLPISLYELSLGNINNAIIITLYSIIVISIIADTFIKPIIIKYINITFIKNEIPINEMIIFFAILAGLSTFGFWGMIIGPAITTFCLSLLNLYRNSRNHKEYKRV